MVPSIGSKILSFDIALRVIRLTKSVLLIIPFISYASEILDQTRMDFAITINKHFSLLLYTLLYTRSTSRQQVSYNIKYPLCFTFKS